MSSFLLFIRIYSQISAKRKYQLLLLFLLILLNGVAEIASLGILLPFVTALIDIDVIWAHSQVQDLSKQFGITSPDQLLMPLTILFIVFIVFASLVKLLNLWCSGRLAAHIGSDLSCKAFSSVLLKPYSYHINANSSTVITGITKQINFIIWALNSSLGLLNGVVVSLFIITTLVFISWKISLSASVTFVALYTSFLLASKSILKSNSRIVANSLKNQLKVLQEGLGSIRDVIMDEAQLIYVEQYRKYDFPLRMKTAESGFISSAPRHLLESAGLLVLAVASYLYITSSQNPALIIPLIGTLALGSQKLLPAFQQIYGCLSQVRSVEVSIVDFLALLQTTSEQVYVQSGDMVSNSLENFKTASFVNISYKYSGSDKKAIKNVSISIEHGNHIGIIGKTGSGKSTFIDILMGLLTPNEGSLFIDDIQSDFSDQLTTQRLRSLISHVPQQIYLSDATIAQNIAFGIPPQNINMEMVLTASKLAQLTDFVEDLPEKFNQFVGERGVKLSGGQRQRIGIARALYRSKPILILDEATSALDNETELKIIEDLKKYSKDLTIVSIAHRLTTLKDCNFVYSFADGTIENIYSNKEFKRLFL